MQDLCDSPRPVATRSPAVGRTSTPPPLASTSSVSFAAREGWNPGFRSCAAWLAGAGDSPPARPASRSGGAPPLGHAAATGPGRLPAASSSYAKVRALTRVVTRGTRRSGCWRRARAARRSTSSASVRGWRPGRPAGRARETACSTRAGAARVSRRRRYCPCRGRLTRRSARYSCRRLAAAPRNAVSASSRKGGGARPADDDPAAGGRFSRCSPRRRSTPCHRSGAPGER